jgi:hypothetical protein
VSNTKFLSPLPLRKHVVKGSIFWAYHLAKQMVRSIRKVKVPTRLGTSIYPAKSW